MSKFRIHQEDIGKTQCSGVVLSFAVDGSALICGVLAQHGEPPQRVPPYLINPIRQSLHVGDSVVYTLDFSQKQGKFSVVDLRLPTNDQIPDSHRTEGILVGSEISCNQITGKSKPKAQDGKETRRCGVIVNFAPFGAVFLRDDVDNEDRYVPKEVANPIRSSLRHGVCVTYEPYSIDGRKRARDLCLRETNKDTICSPTNRQVSSSILKPSNLNYEDVSKRDSRDVSGLVPRKDEYCGSDPLSKESVRSDQEDHQRPLKVRQGRPFGWTINSEHDFGTLNAAWASPGDLPQRLREALCGAEIWIEDNGAVMTAGKELSVSSQQLLKRILGKQMVEGWDRWITGDIGWTLHESAKKQLFVPLLRSLHDIYTAKMKELRTKFKGKNDVLQHVDVLLYKVSLTTEGGTQRQNTERLWTKVAKDGSLQDGVAKVRSFLEVLRYAVRKMWEEIPWLLALSVEDRRRRRKRVQNVVNQLLRSSEQGPDVPVHWAAHPPLSAYPLAVVTASTMTELVVELANILGNLFCPYFPAPVRNLEEVEHFVVDHTNEKVASQSATTDDVQLLTDEFGRVVRINP